MFIFRNHGNLSNVCCCIISCCIISCCIIIRTIDSVLSNIIHSGLCYINNLSQFKCTVKHIYLSIFLWELKIVGVGDY
ncbi:hypothetical protein QLL95_gp0270 [Cotonvirus japonicus]|uniref:Uncharacterized protein n=1 Tax=Cotonvirus japonicus TaxID=2811091 RepID=A0ABM7NRH7_9VIRU|nr:hypothetical protein QLL95_gp0270 [Cotonvirus japonicus]BCS82759.1 hypothetical protein [Cotonvirus japonicus]